MCFIHFTWYHFFFISCSSFFVRLYYRVVIASFSLSLDMRLVYMCVCVEIENLLQYKYTHTFDTMSLAHSRWFCSLWKQFWHKTNFTITESGDTRTLTHVWCASFWKKDGTRKKSQYLCNYTIWLCNGKFVPVKRKMSYAFRMM